MSLSRIIVTGASGMIGSHIIDLVAEKGVEVYAVVRKNSKKLGNIASRDNIRVIECDLNDIAKLADFIDKPCDAFFHLAWDGVFGESRNNALLQEKNIANTLDAIRVASDKKCKKFVIAGSQAEYGIKNEVLTCSTIPNPITAYGIAKNASFQLGKVLSGELGIEINSGRIISAYGARDNDYTMIASTLIKMMKGEKCDLSNCTQIWDYIYSEDVAQAMIAIAESGVNGKAYPIGSGKARKLREYVEEMREIVGIDSAELNYGAIKLSPQAVTHLECDISELTEDTGFMPRYSFSEGIKKTIEWMKTR